MQIIFFQKQVVVVFVNTSPLSSPAEFFGVKPELLNDLDKLQKHFISAAKRGSLTVLGHNFHQFSPHGVTGVVVLAESHMTVHTWPELKYAAVDIFACHASDARVEKTEGSVKNNAEKSAHDNKGSQPWIALDSLNMALQPESYNVAVVDRGL